MADGRRAARPARRHHRRGRRRALRPTRCGRAMRAKRWPTRWRACARRGPARTPIAGGEWPALLATMLETETIRPALRPPSAPRHLGAAGGAPAARRPAGAGRAERRHLAAGGRDRPVDQPADARRARPAAARAAHRPVGARLRRGARRRARAADPRRARRRRADRAVALAGAARCAVRLRARQRRCRRPNTSSAAGASYVAWADALDDPEDYRPWPRPEPRPPLEARPTRLSVSSIEQWRRDPYGLYARRILGLEALDPLEAELGAAERGSRLHDALDEFLQGLSRRACCRPTPSAEFEALGEKHLGDAADGARRARLLVAALPAPGALVRRHRERAPRRRHEAARQRDQGRLTVGPSGRPLTHRGARRPHRRDRARRLGDHRLQDRPRADQQGARGLFAPQLLLEAAMAEQRRLREDRRARRDAVHLSYWQANGLGDGGKVERDQGSDAAGAGDAGAGRTRWPSISPSPATPYTALPWPELTSRTSTTTRISSASPNGRRPAEARNERRRSIALALADRGAAARHHARPFGLGRGQCRHRQDQGADRSRDAPAAGRRASPSASSASPSPRRPRRRCATGWPASSAAGRWPTTRRSTRRSTALIAEAPQAEQRSLARRLFARVLDAPGGINILTIHAFCQALLKRFPLEAGVRAGLRGAGRGRGRRPCCATPRTSRSRRWRAPTRRQELRDALATVAGRISIAEYAELMTRLLGERAWLLARIGDEAGLKRARASGCAERLQLRAASRPIDEPRPARRGACPDRGRRQDRRRARRDDRRLAGGRRRPRRRCCPPIAQVFFTGQGPGPQDAGHQGRDQARCPASRTSCAPRPSGCECAQRRGAGRAHGGAAAARPRHHPPLCRAPSGGAAALDYDDLIVATRRLLESAESAAWVLYKLDGGIDHVLVDEAQDTNPDQWEVIRRLTEEFFVGESAVERERTIFAVGDTKQSIFGFQRADPAQARRDARLVRRDKIRVARARVSSRSTSPSPSARRLPCSTRSTGCSARTRRRSGLAEPGEVIHQHSRKQDPGRVELWPLVARREGRDRHDRRRGAGRRADAAAPAAGAADRGPCQGPDRQRAARAQGRAAARRPLHGAGAPAQRVRECAGARAEARAARGGRRRPAQPGRGARHPGPAGDGALRAAAAGRPQPRLPAEVAAGRARRGQALHPGLEPQRPSVAARCATARASRTSPRRTSSCRAGSPARTSPRRSISSPRRSAPKRGRRRLLERLGREASDPIDELLARALQYQRVEAGSLQGFLRWFEAGGGEIKRDLDANRRQEVRILTVHASKGLQAPIVYLPDTTRVPRDTDRLLAESDGETRLWLPRSDDANEAARAWRAEARDRSLQEQNRLLYVAMTRAEDRLYVGGWIGTKKQDTGCWYDRIAAGLAASVEGESRRAAGARRAAKRLRLHRAARRRRLVGRRLRAGQCRPHRRARAAGAAAGTDGAGSKPGRARRHPTSPIRRRRWRRRSRCPTRRAASRAPSARLRRTSAGAGSAAG